jgi:hypothetical protein
MSFQVKIRQSWNQFQQVQERTSRALEKALRTGAIKVQEGAMRRTLRADTGAMRNAWAVSLENWSDYDRVREAAEQLNPGSETFNEVKPDEPLTAYVSNAMEYAIYHELGTVRMSMMPMLAPAVEEVRLTFAKIVADTLREAGV